MWGHGVAWGIAHATPCLERGRVRRITTAQAATTSGGKRLLGGGGAGRWEIRVQDQVGRPLQRVRADRRPLRPLGVAPRSRAAPTGSHRASLATASWGNILI